MAGRGLTDNLSTHTPAALYESFEPAEARRILRRLEFQYTPKHASWLNMVEIEIGVMVSQCLARRIPTKALLIKELKAWQQSKPREGVHLLAIHGRQGQEEARSGVSRSTRGEWKSGRCLITVTFTVSRY